MDQSQLSLSELQLLIKGALVDAFPEAVWVKAEISELSVNRNGHCYLELIETAPGSDAIVARIRATIWSYTYRMLKPYFETTTGQTLTEGIKVLLQAKPEYHEVYGMSLNVRDIDPTYTLGDMAQQRKEIIHRLEREGVVEMNKEIDLPLVAQRIAIISSPSAAGLQDFLDQVHNNQHQIVFYTRLFPAVMQGKEAPQSIISALEQIYEYEDFFDVVVLIRGGGAQIDLACFDNFDLAFHVAQFPMPVITGIGHDKDDSVVDLVAHTRLKTPTAVAEFLISGAANFKVELDEMESRMITLVTEQVGENQNRLKDIARELDHIVHQIISQQSSRVAFAEINLLNGVNARMKDIRLGLEQLAVRSRNSVKSYNTVHHYDVENKITGLSYALSSRFSKDGVRLDNLLGLACKKAEDGIRYEWKNLESFKDKLRLIDPENVIKRGFSMTLKNGKIIKSVEQLKCGETIETKLSDGSVFSNVEKK